MSISILCPTRGRPTSVARLLSSIRRTAVSDTVEVIFYVDDDDPDLEITVDLIQDDVRSIARIGPRCTLSSCWNRCWDEASGDIAMQCGDDIRFRTPGWDAQIEAAFSRWPDRILLVHGDDGFQHERTATHGFLHRRWVQTVGEFVPGIFASDWADTWLTEVADRLGRRLYLPTVVTEHLHPAAGKAQWDRTHRERLARHSAEGVDMLYATTGPQRDEWVAKLSAVIRQAEHPESTTAPAGRAR